MAGEIGDGPGNRCVAAREHVRHIDHRDIIEFAAADPPWLENAEQAGFMQVALGFLRQAPQRLGSHRALRSTGTSASARSIAAL